VNGCIALAIGLLVWAASAALHAAGPQGGKAGDRTARAAAHLLDRIGCRRGERLLVVYGERKADFAAALAEQADARGVPVVLRGVTDGDTGRLDAGLLSRLRHCVEADEPTVVLVDPYMLADGVLEAVYGPKGDPVPRSSSRVFCDLAIPPDSLVAVWSADPAEVAAFAARLKQALTGCRAIRVTTPAGTDVTLVPRRWTVSDGEVTTAPLEAETNGVIVIDASLYDGPPPAPITLRVEGGRVVEAACPAEQARHFRMLQADLARDDGACLVAELGVGTNPNADPSGHVMESGMARGTCHFGFGRNTMFGGVNRSAMHTDGVLLAPTITADGRTVMAAGVLVADVARPPDVFAVMEAFARAAEVESWPGFEPLSFPLAVYDGEVTYLFGHPSPPEGFSPVEGGADAWAFQGRHPGVLGNAVWDIGGVRCATVLLDRARDGSALEAAGTVCHECFHAFQRARMPGWTANEGDLFTYPVDDAGALALRRLETMALRRALEADDRETADAWVAKALAVRRQRFAGLPESAASFERDVELSEATAAYVQGVVTGAPVPAVPPEGFGPDRVRRRGYCAGQAFCALLDARVPGWQEKLMAAESAVLDVLLGSALGPEVRAAEFGAAELTTERQRAAADIAAFQAARLQARQDYLAKDGWRVVVEAPAGDPFMPAGFDPMNLTVLHGREILHLRYVKVRNGSGEAESSGPGGIVSWVGEHPLFSGWGRLVVAGLSEEPTILREGGRVRLTAPGVTADFAEAEVVQDSRAATVTLRLPEAARGGAG
jgi:hypothetical protein